MKGKDVAQELEAQIRDAIEKMVADIRSSIDDVRELVDQQLTAALQSVQADANTTSFRVLLERALSEFEEQQAADAAAAVPPPSGTVRVKKAVQAIESGRSQLDVLNGLLDQSLEFGSRAALLILKGDTFAGWKGVGFSAAGGDDEAIKRFAAAPGAVPELDQLLREERPIEWEGGNLSQRFGVGDAARSIAIPMVIKDKIAAAVIVEAAETDLDRFDVDALGLLVFTTGLLIDTLAIRKRVPSPSFSSDRSSQQGVKASVSPAAAPSPATPPAAAAQVPQPPRPATPQPSPTPSPSPIPAAVPEREPEAPQPSPAIPPPAPEAPPVAEPSLARTQAGSAATQVPATGAGGETAAANDLAERTSTQYIPPAGLQRRFQRAAPEGEDAKRHDEARRFARLLVSEIKLYNESKVDQGRKNRDLYERLKEDIDRSRQMYDERIPEDVRKSSNYFYDELVRILADGDTEILGL